MSKSSDPPTVRNQPVGWIVGGDPDSDAVSHQHSDLEFLEFTCETSRDCDAVIEKYDIVASAGGISDFAF